jgi:hypothetical protein
MKIRKTLAIIAALAVGGVTIPVLVSLIPSAVFALVGTITGNWGYASCCGTHTYPEN